MKHDANCAILLSMKPKSGRRPIGSNAHAPEWLELQRILKESDGPQRVKEAEVRVRRWEWSRDELYEFGGPGRPLRGKRLAKEPRLVGPKVVLNVTCGDMSLVFFRRGLQ